MIPSRPWTARLALVLLVVCTTTHRFANQLVFDDEDLIDQGSVIHDPGRLPDVWTHHTMVASAADPGLQSVDTYRPVTLTLFFLDAAISGRSPVGYHFTNLLLHIACALLVLAVGERWLGAAHRTAAFYGAAAFAAHPWGVEAHVWINGRSDPLALLFGLAAMLLLLRDPRTTRTSVLAGVAFLLGLLSKETLLLTAPAIALMPGPSGSTAPISARLRHRLPPLVIASVLYLALRTVVLSGLRAHRDEAMLAEAALRLPVLLLDSLRQTVVPSVPYLRSLRDELAWVEPWHAGLALLGLVAILAAAWTARRRQPLLAWSALWFLPPLVPVAIIATVLWPGFGRYLYIPLAGFGWALAAAFAAFSESPRIRPALLRVAAALHVLVLAVLGAVFTHDFRDSEALYGAAITARPDIAMGHGWLGMARVRRGDIAGAGAPLERAVELDPSTPRYLVHAARAALASGDAPRAAALARLGIARFEGRPEEAGFHFVAVNALPERNPIAAVGHLVRCLTVWPDRPDCTSALRALTQEAMDAPEHRAALRAALAESPPEVAARLGPLAVEP